MISLHPYYGCRSTHSGKIVTYSDFPHRWLYGQKIAQGSKVLPAGYPAVPAPQPWLSLGVALHGAFLIVLGTNGRFGRSGAMPGRLKVQGRTPGVLAGRTAK